MKSSDQQPKFRSRKTIYMVPFEGGGSRGAREGGERRTKRGGFGL